MIARQARNVFPLFDLNREMGRLFGDLLDSRLSFGSHDTQASPFPAVNVWESDADVFVETEVPGLKMDDVEIQLLGSELSIKGRREALKNDGVTHHRRERFSGSFERQLTIPVEIDAEKVRAELNDGVLTITLPQAAAARPKKIEVNLKSN